MSVLTSATCFVFASGKSGRRNQSRGECCRAVSILEANRRSNGRLETDGNGSGRKTVAKAATTTNRLGHARVSWSRPTH